jgi:hypothetical protein
MEKLGDKAITEKYQARINIESELLKKSSIANPFIPISLT